MSKSWNYPDYTFVDMHIHILPQVDDGSESMEMSLNMLEIARDNNLGGMILTPHNKGGHRNVTPESQKERLRDLDDEAWDAGIVARDGEAFFFYPGNEIMYDSTVPERLNAGRIQTMADSSYILVEFKPWEDFDYIQNGLRSLDFEGYRVILAHCERYECLVKDISLAYELHRNGILLQSNAGSVLPKMFQPVPKFVNKLLSEEMISFIGTDAHKDEGRAPYMMEAYTYLSKHYDSDYIRDIMRENALRVTRDEEI